MKVRKSEIPEVREGGVIEAGTAELLCPGANLTSHCAGSIIRLKGMTVSPISKSMFIIRRKYS